MNRIAARRHGTANPRHGRAAGGTLSRLKPVLFGAALAILLSACAVRHALINGVDNAIAGTGEVYASDPDVELVGAAAPFGLKLIESLLTESPQHRGLLLAASRRPVSICLPDIDRSQLRIHKAALLSRCAGWRGARLGRIPRFSKHGGELITAAPNDPIPTLPPSLVWSYP